MKAFVFACVLSGVLASPAIAQDDCPAGHVRNPAVSPLDDAYMVSAFKASFRATFGREPSMQAGAGKDDGWYYIRAANHFGIYGDDQCHAGWSGYWESWLKSDHGDLALVQTPAQFQPSVTPPAQPPCIIGVNCLPPAAPGPAEGVLVAKVDALAARVEQLYALEAEQSRADGEAHAAIHQNISDGRAENRSFFAAIGEHWRSITAIAGPLVTYATCRATGKCGS